MGKKRRFPFGYHMIDGQIDLDAAEALVVRFIFQKYSEGISVPKLMERLPVLNVPYREGSNWNKNMICRILDNATYLGNNEYPQIIEESLFEQVSSRRSIIQNGKLNSSLKSVREKICCIKCGQKLARSTHHSKQSKSIVWICPNCGIETGNITDNELLERILGVLNFVITHSAQVTQPPQTVKCLSLEAARLTNEINRKMCDPYTSTDYLLELIKKCAQEKYSTMQNQPVGWKNELLKIALDNRVPLESLDVQLFQEIVSKVFITSNATVTLQLINQKVV